MIKIDVEKIMEEIREDIRKNGYEASSLSFNDIEIRKSNYMEENFNLAKSIINTSWDLKVFAPIQGHGIKRFVKRVVRKIVRASFCQQFEIQQAFNANVVKVINELSTLVNEQQERIRMLENQLEGGE